MAAEEEPMIPEPADPLLRIGEFARRSRLSLKALRLYERLGLLAPAHVGPRNGYRWYAESQLFTARLIVLLRRLDMPLAQVAEVVAAPGERGADVVAAYWEVVERRIAAQRELVTLMETSLRGGSQRFGIYEFREREVPEQLVLTGKRHLQLHELEGWLDETKRQLKASAMDHGGMVAGLFVIYHGEVSPDSDGPVEVCVPISMAREVPSDRTMRREPPHREAYVSVTKAQFEVPQILSAYDAVATWIDSQGLRCVGSPREVYVPDVDPSAAAPSDEVCDVAFPVR